MYGSNFRYTMDQYTQLDNNGLAMFGVHYSDHDNIAVFPRSKYYPKGVYFYFLSDTCETGKRTGFATDRPFANILKINNPRMVIVKKDHPKNFSMDDLHKAANTLEQQGFNLNPKIYDPSQSYPEPFYILHQLLADIDSSGNAYGKLLHNLGYDGIVDYNNSILPIESCQGVMTWPGGATLVQSIPNNQKTHSPNPAVRFNKLISYLHHSKDGNLNLQPHHIDFLLFKLIPTNLNQLDAQTRREAKLDLYSTLVQKLNFNANPKALQHLINIDALDTFPDERDANPTIPQHLKPTPKIPIS